MPVSNIAVIGLGYVGLPLAVALSRPFTVIGYDTDAARVKELRDGHDRTGEIQPSVLRAATFDITDDAAAIRSAQTFIITVPTPVDADNRPDLAHVRAACRTIGAAMKKGAVVVLESTVYPGVTEDIFGPALAESSGLKAGKDFFLGYSPERINPGDREHTIDKITKVVAGQTPEVTDALVELYGAITSGGVFVAKNIKTAEAAKVIENAQRDVNIAFINEVAMIFNRLGLSTHDVLAAAGTKWNFLDFEPGLVGGHCIGVDPFYLAHCAKEAGHNPEIILAGRRINDGMGRFIAERIHTSLGSEGMATSILVLGLTFKENVPDLRNSKVVDMIVRLRDLGHEVTVHDPLANVAEAKELYGVRLCAEADVSKTGGDGVYDCIVGAVAHDLYSRFTTDSFSKMVAPGGLVADIKGLWRHIDLPEGMRRWNL